MDLVGEADAIECGDSLLLDAKQGGDVGFITFVERKWLDGERITDLGTDELSLLGFVLCVAGEDQCLLSFDTAFLDFSILELEHTAVDYVIIFYTLDVYLLACALEHALDLFVLHLLGSSNAVVSELISLS